MAKAGYEGSTEADVALTAATAKTVLSAYAPAQFGIDLRGFTLGFDGVTTTDKPVLVEIGTVDTTGAGTSTAGTVRQIYGRAVTAGFTTNYNYTAEPTNIVVIKVFRVTPNGGTFEYDWPFGETPDNDVSKGFVMRLTAPTSAVNARATFRFERC